MEIILVHVVSNILEHFWRNIYNFIMFIKIRIYFYHLEIGTLFSLSKTRKVQIYDNNNLVFQYSISNYFNYWQISTYIIIKLVNTHWLKIELISQRWFLYNSQFKINWHLCKSNRICNFSWDIRWPHLKCHNINSQQQKKTWLWLHLWVYKQGIKKLWYYTHPAGN